MDIGKVEGDPTGSYNGDGGVEGDPFGPWEEVGENDGLVDDKDTGMVEVNLTGPYVDGDVEDEWLLG